jgi:MFS family permease
MKGTQALHDPYAVLKISQFRLFITGRLCLTLAIQMQGMIVGWQMYKITHEPFSLGLIGLAEAIPSIAVALFAGHIADVYNRKYIIQLSLAVLLLCSFSLFYFTLDLAPETLQAKALPIYFVIFISGIVRGFIGPAIFAFMPQLVNDRSLYSNAVSWNSAIWQAASVTGPALGGYLLNMGINLQKVSAIPYFGSPSVAYAGSFFLLLISIILFTFIPSKPLPKQEKKISIKESLSEGLTFVFGNQIILNAISLDLFAVLFGGAVALLPVFTEKILHVGPVELGYLYAAPAIGSVLMALFISFNPIQKAAGKKLLFAVAGFGICMILFGLSEIFWLSLIILMVSGAFDGVSVVLRSTLIQTLTPEHMKGRVASVNNIFIGSSNEIGAFESGLAAKLMNGAARSVVFGGCITLVVVGTTWLKAKKLRDLDL